MRCLAHDDLRSASQVWDTAPFAGQFDAVFADGHKQEKSGRFAEALETFSRAARLAHQASDIDREAKALLRVGVCEIRLFQYRAALETLGTVRQLALQANDNLLGGAAAGNLSTIYTQLGDLALASRNADTSVRLLEQCPRKELLATALLNEASLQLRRGEVRAGMQSSDHAITVAQETGLPAVEAMAWDLRGISLLLAGDTSRASDALDKAYSARLKMHDEDGLAITEEHLAELHLKKHDYGIALGFIKQAFTSPSPSFKLNPQYYPLHIWGQILLGLAHADEALAKFRLAVDSANQWRQGALPGDVTSTRTVAMLHDVYQDYAALAAEFALKRQDPALAREALESLAENRAASLREQLTRALGSELRLPPRYFELLSALQSLQSKVTLGENPRESEAKLQDIRVQLSELENQIGIQTQNIAPAKEKTPYKNSLRDIQLRLSGSEMLLSFCLGENKSFLWAVTGDHVDLYELPRESEIATKSKAFAEAIRNGSNAAQPGRSLRQQLFGKLGQDAERKPDWLVVSDGVLLSGVPFSALPDGNSWLSVTHTLRFLPSELLLVAAKPAQPQQGFLGVGDPIYNVADSRRVRSPKFVQTQYADGSITLARLAGSDREIRDAAKMSGMPEPRILVGREASGAMLREALRKTPEILHFAVHVVSPPERPQEAALALSIGDGNMPELLTAEVVAAYRVPGTVVVLSGCSSQQGETLPSAGLIGLSRAWLLAGASAVIVSAWPTPDDSGQFFSAFYGHFQQLKSGSPAKRAAAALRAAQLDMQRSGGYRSSPSFWAAYSIISKE